LGGLSLDNSSTFSSNMCDNRDEDEPQLENEKEEKKIEGANPSRSIDEASEKDYQEVVDYMLNAIDEFGKLPDAIEEDIKKQT
jgi:soluble cytochrome b562